MLCAQPRVAWSQLCACFAKPVMGQMLAMPGHLPWVNAHCISPMVCLGKARCMHCLLIATCPHCHLLLELPYLQEGGALAVAPEWRNSLYLKGHELWAKAQEGDKASGEALQVLTALVAMPFVDILDESDELLHHRYACDVIHMALISAGMISGVSPHLV